MSKRGMATFVIGSVMGIAAGMVFGPMMGVDSNAGNKMLKSGRRLARKAGKSFSNMM